MATTDDDDMTERQKSEESSAARVLCIKHFSHSAVFFLLPFCLCRCMYSRWTQTPRRLSLSLSLSLPPSLKWIHHAEHLKNDQADHAAAARKSTEVGPSVGRLMSPAVSATEANRRQPAATATECTGRRARAAGGQAGRQAAVGYAKAKKR